LRHPLEFVPAKNRNPLFFGCLGLTVGLFAVFQVLNVPLQTAAAPGGIVSFELAGSLETAIAMIASWTERGSAFALFGLGLDYLFMPSYALALSLGLLLASGRHGTVFARVGIWLGWGVFLAALLDAVENFALLRLLLGDLAGVWPSLAFWCASGKFALLLIGVLFALAGWLLPKRSN
jgi:hypothetical protein